MRRDYWTFQRILVGYYDETPYHWTRITLELALDESHNNKWTPDHYSVASGGNIRIETDCDNGSFSDENKLGGIQLQAQNLSECGILDLAKYAETLICEGIVPLVKEMLAEAKKTHVLMVA